MSSHISGACPVKTSVATSCRSEPSRTTERKSATTTRAHGNFVVVAGKGHDHLEGVKPQRPGFVYCFCGLASRKSAIRTVCYQSTTRSARRSSDCGTMSPRALAILRLIAISNFVGCSTGRSPGFAPLRIRSTYIAVRLKSSALSG
jgi:hypothetical protein